MGRTSLSCAPGGLAGLTRRLWATPVIVTSGSARWAGPLVRAYAAAGLRPLFLVDDHSTDGTAAALAAAGADVRPIRFDPPRVEAAVRQLGRITGAEWVVRLDDDEFPSAELLNYLMGQPPAAASVAVPRRWVRATPAGAEAARTLLWQDGAGVPGADHQWRIFRPVAVRYTDALHTAGFEREDWVRAPADAALFHLNWVFQSYAERRRKLAGYEAAEPGMGRFFESMYLPEHVEPAHIGFDPVTDPGLLGLLREYGGRFPPRRPGPVARWLHRRRRIRY